MRLGTNSENRRSHIDSSILTISFIQFKEEVNTSDRNNPDNRIISQTTLPSYPRALSNFLIASGKSPHT